MNLQSPLLNIQLGEAEAEVGVSTQAALIIEQGSGTNPAQTLIEDIQSEEVNNLLGEGSLSYYAYEHFRQINKYTEIDVITLDEPSGGTAAQGGFRFVGTALENKTLNLVVGDEAFKVSITVVKNETASALATKLVAAITAADIPFTAAVDGTDDQLVLITFAVKGECGNGLVCVEQERVLGLTFSRVRFTGGAGAYDVTNVLSQITKRYQTIIIGESMPFDTITDFVESRFNAANEVLDGVVIYSSRKTKSVAKTAAEGRNQRSGINLINIQNKLEWNMLSILVAAEVGAIRALRFTEGAPLSDLSVKIEEKTGGVNKASLPYHNVPLARYKKPYIKNIDIAELTEMNNAGVSLIVDSPSGAVLGDLVTLYKTDGSGQANKTWKFLNAVDVGVAIREILFNNCKSRLAQTRASTGAKVAGVAMETPEDLRGYLIELYDTLVDNALVVGDQDSINTFKDNLTVTLDSEDGKFKVLARRLNIIVGARSMTLDLGIGFAI